MIFSMKFLRMKVYSFENLACWQSAKELSVWIYKATRSFPAEEKFGLVSQMRRAAVSIASNLAEGSSRMSSKDQAHFSSVAYSSTVELLNDLIIAKELEFLTGELYSEGREKIEWQTFLISKLRQTQLLKSESSKPTKPPKPSKP